MRFEFFSAMVRNVSKTLNIPVVENMESVMCCTSAPSIVCSKHEYLTEPVGSVKGEKIGWNLTSYRVIYESDLNKSVPFQWSSCSKDAAYEYVAFRALRVDGLTLHLLFISYCHNFLYSHTFANV